MSSRKTKPGENKALRQMAEQVLAEKGKKPSAAPGPDVLFELEVNRTELEIQNEELRSTNEELMNAKELVQEARDSYAELYDLAPVAYFTVDTLKGDITQVNLTACEILKIPRSACKGHFTKFIEPEYADAYHICVRKAIQEPFSSSCEVKMRRSDGTSFWAELHVRGAAESKEVRIAVTDITERKNSEQIKDDFIGMVS
ncbi:MAG TPA: PAS domain S-box protein, partial [Dehalococcoidales bacterium]|nr:PAS domain S-box protein [Dehalococcoidales bacterium]